MLFRAWLFWVYTLTIDVNASPYSQQHVTLYKIAFNLQPTKGWHLDDGKPYSTLLHFLYSSVKGPLQLIQLTQRPGQTSKPSMSINIR